MNKSTLFIIVFFLSINKFVLSQFSQANEYIRTIYDPKDFEVGDLDNDGWMDIVIFHSQEDKIGWFKNLGDGQYAQQETIGGIINAHGIELLDLDLDGDLDIVAASLTTLVKYINQGNGNFSAGITIATLPILSRFISNDIDQDGDIDLFVCTNTSGNPSSVYFYENNGGALLPSVTLVSNIVSLKDIRLADLDGDNYNDLIICSELQNTVAWYKNLGTNTFSGEQIISTSQSQPKLLNVGDIDGDGDIDVLSGSENTGTVVWYANQGSGTFNAAQIVATAASSIGDICVKDLNGDQYPEVITGRYANSTLRVGIYEYNPATGFAFDSYLTENNSSNKIVIEDMDNDGDNDVLNTHSSALLLNYNNGLGSFGNDIPFSVWGNPDEGSFVDMDVDGDLDIFVINGAYWLENLGDSTYGAIYHFLPNPSGSEPISAALMTDFNNDGLPDFVCATTTASNGIPSVHYFRNLGNQNFASEVYITSEQFHPVHVSAGDLNNDGFQDLLVGSGAEAAYYLNNGNNTFGTKNSLASTQWCQDMEAADLDNDGNLDILFVSEIDNTVNWCKNLGTSFANPVVITTSNIWPNGINCSDIDGDNDLDLFVASRSDNKISLYKNLGAGVFSTEQVISSTTATAFDVLTEDFDLDGDKDLLTVGVNDYISWYENLGNGNFGPVQPISTIPIGVTRLACGDADNDGDMDILEVNYSTNSINVYENYNISALQVKGRLFVDQNINGIYESYETAIPQLSIQCTPTAAYSYSYPDGRYFMLFNGLIGNYQIAADSLLFWDTSTPSSYSITMGQNYTSINNLDFGFYPDTIVDTLETAFVGGFPRCNSNVNFWFDLENIGTTSPSGIIDILLDDSLTYVSSVITPDSIVGQHLYWAYDSLDHFETMLLEFEVLMPDFNSIGYTLLNTATVITDSMGSVVFTSTDTLQQTLICAYDPNDKSAWPTGQGPQGYIWPAPNSIEYLIRFQNTGNDTALTVVITDQLDQHLDWTSLRPISASHPYHVEMSLGGEVSFVFEDIMLPDSNINEAASHGFVLYSIDVLPNMPRGTIVENTANIYFDFNPAVVTNTVIHTFDTLEIATNELSELINTENVLIYPNPFNGIITIQTKDLKLPYFIEIYDLSGQQQFVSSLIQYESYQCDLSTLANGLYLVQIKDTEGQVKAVRKIIRK